MFATNNEVQMVEKTETSNVVNIRSARKAQEKAQQELLDYMMWTMKHDMDPHRLHDDPIEVFREEMKAKMKSAQDVA
ncbi:MULTISPECIES: hypothetical protein [unclassified Oleiphilus]|jgi:hypothetical protein|uniref:hypothetical protein n=1 Tax=unclassified Oleiphilus TaxID=2631174 RepID=UPI0007C29A9A|nr:MULTISPECIES: hypothetical protein [unclassified Oleiphilus]KZY45328.1 hypothetical protein A3732_01290 [Oleiphilus sp. HI0050]KZY75749.1 hypothetical protein A3740_14555 [Oleiphilus sp. HI0068]KZY81344.1 hypothetical protein A3741_04265 [Oleiphilus sp. HI0069]KZZ46726.1 hypothetical protein A3755_17925 [Oleiphilus sp. HI0085]KZZ33587.1 hypothetical protein A3757_03820 [Oleiphilus sp. HI0117]